MARGNVVTITEVRHMFGLYILKTKYDSFLDYDRLYVSKNNMVIGNWKTPDYLKDKLKEVYSYKDYLYKLPEKTIVLKVTEKYIICKPEK